MRKKEIHRAKIIEFVSNPENPFLSWTRMSHHVLKHKNPKSVYHLFDAGERDAIFKEALELRRKRYTCLLAEVDKALFHKAMTEGDPSAAKLLYQRFEGWAATEKREHVLSFEDRLRQIQEKKGESEG